MGDVPFDVGRYPSIPFGTTSTSITISEDSTFTFHGTWDGGVTGDPNAYWGLGINFYGVQSAKFIISAEDESGPRSFYRIFLGSPVYDPQFQYETGGSNPLYHDTYTSPLFSVNYVNQEIPYVLIFRPLVGSGESVTEYTFTVNIDITPGPPPPPEDCPRQDVIDTLDKIRIGEFDIAALRAMRSILSSEADIDFGAAVTLKASLDILTTALALTPVGAVGVPIGEYIASLYNAARVGDANNIENAKNASYMFATNSLLEVLRASYNGTSGAKLLGNFGATLDLAIKLEDYAKINDIRTGINNGFGLLDAEITKYQAKIDSLKENLGEIDERLATCSSNSGEMNAASVNSTSSTDLIYNYGTEYRLIINPEYNASIADFDIIVYDTDYEALTGELNNKTIFGTEGETTLYLYEDREYGGIETTIFADYVFLNDNRGNSVVLYGVEKIWFSEGGKLLYDLTSENSSFAYRIYAAAYGRTPDEDGLRFWIDVLDDRGEGPPDTADKEFIASFFLTADEFHDAYGDNPTNEQYINGLYQNVLHREADQGGYDFWLGKFASGQGKDDLLIYFTDSTENLQNTAPDLDNGIWVL